MMKSYLQQNKSGFTLLELLLVIAIISVLAGLVIFNLRPADILKSANDVKTAREIKQIEDALKAYALDHDGNYPSAFGSLASGTYDLCLAGQSGCTANSIDLEELVTEGYLSEIPKASDCVSETKTCLKISYNSTSLTVVVAEEALPTPIPTSVPNNGTVFVTGGQYHTCAIKSGGQAYCWGNNENGQLNIPVELTNAIDVSTNVHEACAIQSGGQVYCWGSWGGSLGDYIPAGLTNAVAISVDGIAACAIQSGGQLYCWGNNYFGQLNIPSGLTNAIAVSSGALHTCAIQSGGQLYCWGDNAYGQLNIPTEVTNAFRVTTGYGSTCAIQSGGQLYCWGYNSFGQNNVPAALTNAIDVSSYNQHTCAIQSGGQLYCWGRDGSGETIVPVGLSNVIDVKVGGYHTCAIQSEGQLSCWGYNDYGQVNIPIALVSPTSADLLSIVMTSLPSNNIQNLSGNTYTHNGLSVSNSESSVTLTPIEIDGAPINRTIKIDGSVITPGSPSASISLIEGVEKTINVIVSESAMYSKVYTLKITRTPPTLSIGLSYQGGKIAYIDGTGMHGIIAAASNQTSAEWGCSGTVINGAHGRGIGSGNQNTIEIMAACPTAGIAARVCGDLSLNGYDDWYLPSIDELSQFWTNRGAIGGFGGGYYWSSSEYGNTNSSASVVYFNYGGTTGLPRTNVFPFRCARSF
ncbi:prepilin-type N-terminal cleavage/methylation domain-containing protein [Candidatus Dojkabacteria bacterium]|nr:prepilin-type N-terminal cleavage/methylation domain-containing protein [Candidatus Dojkabacteria bacterium]